MTRFWPWLIRGVPNGRSGIAQVFWDWKTPVFVIFAVALAWATADRALSDMAGGLVMLPIMRHGARWPVLRVGADTPLCSLLQSSRELSRIHRRDRDNEGIEDYYVFGYQFAILSTLTRCHSRSWGLAALANI